MNLPEQCNGCGANFIKDHRCFCHGVDVGLALSRETHGLAHRSEMECLMAAEKTNPLVALIYRPTP